MDSYCFSIWFLAFRVFQLLIFKRLIFWFGSKFCTFLWFYMCFCPGLSLLMASMPLPLPLPSFFCFFCKKCEFVFFLVVTMQHSAQNKTVIMQLNGSLTDWISAENIDSRCKNCTRFYHFCFYLFARSISRSFLDGWNTTWSSNHNNTQNSSFRLNFSGKYW